MSMQLLTAAAQQCAVGGVLHKRVLKQIDGVGRYPSPKNQFGIGQSRKGRVEFGFPERRDGGKQAVGKISADYRSDLRRLLRRAKTVKAGDK